MLAVEQPVVYVCVADVDRLAGDQVEMVVAMFVNRDRPNSVRITPSRGDGGVDILERGAGPGGSDVVYQVKRYTDRLTSRQKQEIEGSLHALETDGRWEGLTITHWVLVTPWDPTPEAESWLQGLVPSHWSKVWHGLTWVDQQAARYPDIVDYYLHGGRLRVEEAYAEMMSLVGAERNLHAGLTACEVSERLQRALAVLDHDPHYRYELRFGEGPIPKGLARPGAVLQATKSGPGGRWVSIDVIARCAASTTARPITITGTIAVEPGTESAYQLDAFFTYGAPITDPILGMNGVLDAPGGLGRQFVNASIRMLPVDDQDLGSNQELHLEVLDSSHETVAVIDVRRVERSHGINGGIRVVLEEATGLFRIEDRYDLTAGSVLRSLKTDDFTGRPVTVAAKAARFLSQLHEPNVVRLSIPHTDPNRGVLDPNFGLLDSDENRAYFEAVSRILDTLAFLQGHAAETLYVPDFAAVDPQQLYGWHRTADLLRGEIFITHYPHDHALFVEIDGEVVLIDGEDLRIRMPLQVYIGTQLIDLGHMEAVLTNPTLISRHERANGRYLHAFTTPDNTVRWRRHCATS